MFRALAFSVCLAMAPLLSLAEDRSGDDAVSPKDAHAIRVVVEAQLKALASENSAEAFAYATPEIRRQFGDAARFSAMVRSNYPMLIRPASVSFMRPEAGNGIVIQAVQFRDREGNFWRAVYELHRQSDKHWRINGCAVGPDDDSSTT